MDKIDLHNAFPLVFHEVSVIDKSVKREVE